MGGSSGKVLLHQPLTAFSINARGMNSVLCGLSAIKASRGQRSAGFLVSRTPARKLEYLSDESEQPPHMPRMTGWRGWVKARRRSLGRPSNPLYWDL